MRVESGWFVDAGPSDQSLSFFNLIQEMARLTIQRDNKQFTGSLPICVMKEGEVTAPSVRSLKTHAPLNENAEPLSHH